jgi:hypothetical protein
LFGLEICASICPSSTQALLAASVTETAFDKGKFRTDQSNGRHLGAATGQLRPSGDVAPGDPAANSGKHSTTPPLTPARRTGHG